MPSMKWIKEQSNHYLGFYYPQKMTLLENAEYNHLADIVWGLVFWLEAQDKMERMAKKIKKEAANG